MFNVSTRYTPEKLFHGHLCFWTLSSGSRWSLSGGTTFIPLFLWKLLLNFHFPFSPFRLSPAAKLKFPHASAKFFWFLPLPLSPLRTIPSIFLLICVVLVYSHPGIDCYTTGHGIRNVWEREGLSADILVTAAVLWSANYPVVDESGVMTLQSPRND